MRKDGQSWEGLSWRKNVDLFSSILQLCEEEEGKKIWSLMRITPKNIVLKLFYLSKSSMVDFFLIVTESPALLPSLQLSLNHYHAVMPAKSTCLLL